MKKEPTEIQRPDRLQVYDEHVRISKERAVYLMDVAQTSTANHMIDKRARAIHIVQNKARKDL